MDSKRYRQDYISLSNELINLKNNFLKIKSNIMNRVKSENLVLTGLAMDTIELCNDQINFLDDFESFLYVAYEVQRNQYNSRFNSLKINVKRLESADDEYLFSDDDTPGFMKLRF